MNTDAVMVEVALQAAPVEPDKPNRRYALVSERPGMLAWPMPVVCWN